MNRAERFQLFLRRLEAAPPAGSAPAALALLTTVLNAIEDELSGVPFAPSWQDDGRMYPPQEDMARPLSPQLTEYRSRAHSTYIAADGAFAIVRRRDHHVEISKAGRTGKRLRVPA